MDGGEHFGREPDKREALPCAQTLAMLDDYLSNELPPGLAAAVSSHVATCAVCGGVLRGHLQARDALRKAVQSQSVPEGLAGRVESGLHEPRLVALPGGTQSITACGQIAELTTDYISGELPGNLERGVAQHLSTCPGCRRKAEELEGLKRSVARAVRSVPVPPGLAERLRPHVAPRRWMFNGLVAACLAGLAILIPLAWPTVSPLPPKAGRLRLPEASVYRDLAGPEALSASYESTQNEHEARWQAGKPPDPANCWALLRLALAGGKRSIIFRECGHLRGHPSLGSRAEAILKAVKARDS